MKVIFADRASIAIADAPGEVRKAFHKQLAFLVHDLHHPSLRSKKYDKGRDIWQARVNNSWRFYFRIIGNTYVIEDIVPHPK